MELETLASEKEALEVRLQELELHRPRCEELLEGLGRPLKGATVDWRRFAAQPPEAATLERLLVSQANEQAFLL